MAISLSEVQAAVNSVNEKLDTVLTTIDSESTQAATYREEQKAAIAQLQSKVDELLAGEVVDPAEVQSILNGLSAAGAKIDTAIANIQAIQE